MRMIATFAALALGACAPEQAPPAQAAAAAPTPAVTAAMLVGRWGDNGDCTKDIVFSADGSFASFTGGRGVWSLSGDTVTMQGDGGAFTVRVALIDENTLMIGNADGTSGISQRCP